MKRSKFGFARDYQRVGFAKKIHNALRPPEQSSNLKTLADLSPEERAAIERQYGMKIKP